MRMMLIIMTWFSLAMNILIKIIIPVMLMVLSCITGAFGYDPGRTGQSDYVGPSKEVRLAWKKTIGPVGFTSLQPVVTNDARVYVNISSDDMLTVGVVSLAPDGKEIWRYEIKAEPNRMAHIYSLAMSPDSANIYLLTTKNDATFLVCLDSLNGLHRWSLNIDGHPRNDSNMVVSRDGAMYFANRLGVYGVSQQGKLLWSRLVKDTQLLKAVFSPALSPDEKTLYLIMHYPGKEEDNSHFFVGAVDTAQGKLKWRGDYLIWKKQAFEGIAVDPKSGTIYTGGLGSWSGTHDVPGFLYAFNPDGSLKWRYEVKKGGAMGNVFPSVGRDGTVYITTGLKRNESTGTGLIAVDSNGKLKWRYEPADTYGASNPVLIDKEERLYFLFSASTGDTSHNGLYCMDKQGKLIFKYDNIKENGNFWGFTPVLSPDGAIYFVAYQGVLYALK